MNPDTHEQSNLFCPTCLVKLTRVKANGNLFCPVDHPDICDYGHSYRNPARNPPLTELEAETARVAAAEKYVEGAKNELEKAIGILLACNKRLEQAKQN